MMGLLYPDKASIKYFARLEKEGEDLVIVFSCDGGKMGTDEDLCDYQISARELMTLLDEHFNGGK